MTDDGCEPPRGPSLPTRDDSDDGLSESDRALQEALIHEINPGGLDAFDETDWQQFVGAVLEHSGVDPGDVVMVHGEDGVELVDRTEWLESKEAIAAAADLASKYLRRIEGWPIAEIAALSDLELVRAFLSTKGYLPGEDD